MLQGSKTSLVERLRALGVELVHAKALSWLAYFCGSAAPRQRQKISRCAGRMAV
jgi:hypothetical protein